MTVKEFIKLLERMPQDMKVSIPIPNSMTHYNNNVVVYIYQNQVKIEGD